jgi:hypothetical protein
MVACGREPPRVSDGVLDNQGRPYKQGRSKAPPLDILRGRLQTKLLPKRSRCSPRNLAFFAALQPDFQAMTKPGFDFVDKM